MAAIATFALKAGVWFRRGRLVIVSPDSLGTTCQLSGRNSTYRPVQISGTGSDGRKAAIHNSAFGTAYAIVDGNPLPVCDHVGFAPFGFGYRRCPAEQLTIKVFEDFLRKVWNSKIELKKLDIANPESLPIGPNSVISDDLGFFAAK